MPFVNLLHMRGAWGGLSSRAYEAVIAEGAVPLYARLVDEELSPRIPTGARVLDVGSGPGHVACLLAERRPDLEVFGVDLSATMVARATRRVAGGARVRFEVGDATALPYPDGAFDFSYSVASIKHWPDPVVGVREMARTTRPGGAVAVLETDPQCSREAARRFTEDWRWKLPGTRRALAAWFRLVVARQGVPANRLCALLEEAGLRDVRSDADPDLPFSFATGRRATRGGAVG